MGRVEKLFSLFLATLMFSFIGWVFETLLFLIAYGSWYDRGFLTLPFCPIYGFTLLIIYLLFGTTKSGGVLLNRIKKGSLRVVIYYILCCVTASLSEYFVGTLTEKFTGRVLWDYSMYPLALGRYVCIEVAIVWGFLICFATYLFDYLVKRFQKLRIGLLIGINITSWSFLLIDFIANLLVE